MSNELLIKNALEDLNSAGTVGYFDMRVEELKEYGGKIPDNIDILKQKAVKRNITRLENDIKNAKTEGYKSSLQEQLIELKQTYKMK